VTTVIDKLVYKIVSDTGDFTTGVKGTRRELALAKRVMLDTQKPADQLAAAERGLEQLYQKRLITLPQYQAALKKTRDAFVPMATAVDRQTGGLNALGQAFGINLSSMTKWTAGLAAAAGAAKLTARFARGLSDTLRDLDKEFKLAATVGIEVNELRALEIASDRAGIGADKLQNMLKRLARVTGDTVNNTGEARVGFEMLSIDMDKFLGLPVEERMVEIARAIGDLGTREAQVSATAKIFEAEGRDLVRVFDALRDSGITPFREEVERLGLAMDEGDIARLQDFNDTLSNFGKRGQGLQESFLAGAVEETNALAGAVDAAGVDLSVFANIMGKFGSRQVLDTVIGKQAGDALRGAVGLWGEFGETATTAADRVTESVDDMSDGLKEFIKLTDTLRAAPGPDPFEQEVSRMIEQDDPAGRDPFEVEFEKAERERRRQLVQPTAANTALLRGSTAAISFEEKLKAGRGKEISILTRIEKNTRSATPVSNVLGITEVGLSAGVPQP